MSAQAAAAPVTLHRPLAAEEAARADFYALLATMLNAPPDGALLANLAAAGALEGDPEEYEALFGGVGKAAVSLYAGYYMGAPAIDHPRVRIQASLVALALARDARATEPEDHLAGLLEVMRVLVAGGAGRQAASLAEQKAFYREHVEPAASPFFEALARAPQSNYYRHVAAVGAAFVAIESQSFQLD